MALMAAVASKPASFPLCQLDQVCLDESLSDVPASESRNQNVRSILELLEQPGQADRRSPALGALSLVVSALDGKQTL